MKVQLACLLAKELLEQNTFSEGDRKKLDRFDRKDKDGKFVKKINQEVGEFFEELTKTGDVTTFMEQNGIKKDDELYGGHWQRFPFYKEQDGKLVQQPLTFGTGYKDRETAYNEFIKNNLQSFINKYNGVIVETADAAAQLSSDIAHNPELGVTKHAAWALDNADAIKDAGTQRDMKRAEKRANKFEAKRQKRLLDLLDDQEDAIVDTIRDHLKTSNPELNKRQRKVFADMLFDRLYSYDDLTKVPDPIELTHTFKNPVPIKVSTSGLATIFASVQVYKADYRAEKGLDADRRASRFQRKLDAAEADKQEAFEEYTDLLDASATMTIDGESKPVDNNYRTAVLLSDINFDGAMLPAKDLADGEFKRNWLGRILVEGVLRSVGMSQDKSGDGQNYRKYAKSFKNQPINNNLETQISTAREIARARKGAEVVDANLKALLQKGFGEAAIPTEKPLYDILKENIEYSMFLKRIFIMEPDILVGLFEHGPKALDIKYAALHEQQKRTQNGADVANTQKIAAELMNDPEAKQLALDKIKESDIEAVKSELIRLRNDANTPEPKKKELDKLIKGLDKQENRNKLRWQLASGGLMAMVGAQYRERHQVIYTYDNHANVPILADATGKRLPYDLAYNDDGTPKPGTQATNTYEDANTRKDKLKRTNFSYGLGTGGTLLAESNGSYKQSVTYGISALYSDFATNDPSQQKDGFSFGLSFGYNGTQGLGQVGTSNSYKANINFGVGVGMGADMQGNFVFGPYVYLSPDVLLNGGKLTHTLDAKGAVRLRAGVSGSLNKGLLSFVPNMGLSNDRIEGYTIIEDNLKNKVGPILENILLGLRGRDLSAAATQTEMEKMYADVVMSIDEKLGRSKPKNINKAAKLLSSILSVYAGSDVTKHDDYEAHVKAIAPELATVFANQRWNENIEALRGWKITSVNVGSIFALALFGITPLSIASAVLGTVGTTAYGRAVAENNKPSLAEAQEDFEQNYSATEVVLEPTDPNNLGLGNAASVKLIRDTLVSKDPSLADEVGTLVSSNNAGNLRLDKRVAGLIEVRIANAFTVGEDAAAKTYPITDYLKTDGDFLVIPADMAGGVSELVDKNTRKTTLTIGVPVGEPIADAVVWKGTETFAGDPNKFNGTGEVALVDLNAKLQAIAVGTTTPLAGMSFAYDAVGGVLTLNGTGAVAAPTVTQTGLLGSDKLITISKDATGSYALAIADHNDAAFKGLKIDYKETTNVVGADFGAASRLNFNNAAYEALFDQSFINQFADAKLLRSIMRGKYHKIYNAFNAAMVAGDYTTAKIKAEALLGSLQQDKRITTSMTFATDNDVLLQKQLFRFEALLIYSNACYCDDLHGNSGEVDFSKFVLQQDPSYKQFDGLMKIRKVGFARRVKNTFKDMAADLTTTRNTVADKLSGVANANGQKLNYARRDGAVGLVFGYPEQAGVKDRLESKIVYNPRAITESITKMDIKDPVKNAELMKAFTDKMDVINGADRLKNMLIDKVTTQQAKDEITNNFQAIYDQFLKGEIRTGQYATVDLDFSFFFYPNCANEGILLEANVAEKPYTPTQNVGNAQVERGLPGPTGFWLNAPSVMQRAEVTAVNFGVTAAGTYTKDIPSIKLTDPQGPIRTTDPQIFTLPDGTQISVNLAPNTTQEFTLADGTKFTAQFLGFDDNNTPYWNFNFIDSGQNALGSYNYFNDLKNSTQWQTLDPGLKTIIGNFDTFYAGQTAPLPVTPDIISAPPKDYIAVTAVNTINNDRKGLSITRKDRTKE